MKVSIERNKKTTTFGNLQTGVVFECGGEKFMKISIGECTRDGLPFGEAYRALNLSNMVAYTFSDKAEFPANSIFVPEEIILK